MTAELVVTRKYRNRIPESHRGSLDTRILWLWNQRLGTVQTIWRASQSGDVLDHTAATLILQAVLGKDLDSIVLIFQRLEGGALLDEQVNDRESPTMPM